MNKLTDTVKSLAGNITRAQVTASYTAMAEELFEDYYRHRRQVYKMNFFRGIFFGLGSVLGGTVVVALILWVLSFFVNFPLFGDYLRQTQQTIQERGR